MSSLSAIPTSQALEADLQRKMLVLLSSMFLATSLFYIAWILATDNARLAVVPTVTAAIGAAALLATRLEMAHRLVLNALCVGVFVTMGGLSLVQQGLSSSALLWLTIPMCVAVFSGAFRLGLTFALLYVGLVAYLHHFGQLATIEPLTSRIQPVTQRSLALVFTTAILVAFFGMAAHWIAKLQGDLKRARQLATDALDAKALFFARMTHEIRTPLNGMLGATELLQAPTTPEWQREQLQQVQAHSAKMLLSVVNDILDFSKLEAKQMAAEEAPFRLRLALFQVTELFSVQAFNKGLDITVSRAPDVPRVVIGDEHRLRQILTNLVNNAIKFTDRGGVHIAISVDHTGRQSAHDDRMQFLIEVSDTGRGISQAALRTLFTPYRQTDSSVARVYGGTGLGLSICRQLAELMGGTIDATSVEGVGTTFVLRLPLRFDPAQEIDPVPRAASAATHGPAIVASAWPGLHRQMESLMNELGVPAVMLDHLPTLDEVRRHGAGMIFIDVPLLADAGDAKRSVRELVDSGVRVALLAPLGSDTMVGAAVAATLIYKPLRRDNIRSFVEASWPPAPPSPADPVQTSSADIAVGASTHPATAGKPVPLAAASAWRRVLVADDSLVNQVVTQAMLEGLDCACVLAQDGEEAVQAYRRGRFDLILMDVQMPGMDGVEATRAIREIERQEGLPRTPIVAMSGFSDAISQKVFAEAGMDDALSKPFVVSDLRALLKSTPPASPTA